jgi:hypothetical protein
VSPAAPTHHHASGTRRCDSPLYGNLHYLFDFDRLFTYRSDKFHFFQAVRSQTLPCRWPVSYAPPGAWQVAG